jgi:hypothetical protein
MVPISDTAAVDEKNTTPVELLKDSGILFFLFDVPDDAKKIAYRLIIDGLWTSDPLNPEKLIDSTNGLEVSLAPLPSIKKSVSTVKPDSSALEFLYRSSSGQTITVAGDFNGWDPFLYELTEVEYGVYSLTLPVPAGTWRYVFYQNGKRVPDPNNKNRVYTRDGSFANVAVVN